MNKLGISQTLAHLCDNIKNFAMMCTFKFRVSSLVKVPHILFLTYVENLRRPYGGVSE